MAKAVQPAYLYSPYRNFYVYFDAIIDREVSLSATVPQYPTEKGTYFSESVLRRPRTLSITAFISDTLVTWRNKIPVDYVISRYESEKNNLERFYFDGQLLDFYSGGRKYKNVVIEKLSIPEVPEMINASEIKMTLQQVELVGEDTVSVEIDNYGRDGETNTDGGTVWSNVVGSGGIGLINRRDEYK